jgi:hypothetical protein
VTDKEPRRAKPTERVTQRDEAKKGHRRRVEGEIEGGKDGEAPEGRGWAPPKGKGEDANGDGCAKAVFEGELEIVIVDELWVDEVASGEDEDVGEGAGALAEEG